MWEEIKDCSFYIVAIVFMVVVFSMCYVMAQRDRDIFFSAHHCRDIPNGYVCSDGAVIR